MKAATFHQVFPSGSCRELRVSSFVGGSSDLQESRGSMFMSGGGGGGRRRSHKIRYRCQFQWGPIFIEKRRERSSQEGEEREAEGGVGG